MLKLLKVELRKERTALLVLLGVIAALEVYFLWGEHVMGTTSVHVSVAIVLLVMSSFACGLFVIIRGITSYTSELNTKSGYMMFMTPNPALKILGSKYLFTFVNGLLFTLLLMGLAILDIWMLVVRVNGAGEVLSQINTVMSWNGMSLWNIVSGVLFIFLFAFFSLLSFLSVVYISVTLVHTFLSDKKWRWFPAVLLFLVLSYLIGQLERIVGNPGNQMEMLSQGQMHSGEETARILGRVFTEVVIPALVPQMLLCLGIIVISLLACSYMLEKKISL